MEKSVNRGVDRSGPAAEGAEASDASGGGGGGGGGGDGGERQAQARSVVPAGDAAGVAGGGESLSRGEKTRRNKAMKKARKQEMRRKGAEEQQQRRAEHMKQLQKEAEEERDSVGQGPEQEGGGLGDVPDAVLAGALALSENETGPSGDAPRPRWRMCVIGGRTGVGKTRVLHALRNILQQHGQQNSDAVQQQQQQQQCSCGGQWQWGAAQVIDLEGLAMHRGSTFGWCGQEGKAQPSSEHFGNTTAIAWRAAVRKRPDNADGTGGDAGGDDGGDAGGTEWGANGVADAQKVDRLRVGEGQEGKGAAGGAGAAGAAGAAASSFSCGARCVQCPTDHWVFVEDEDAHVGMCETPPGLYALLRCAPLVVRMVVGERARVQVCAST
jgi:hypothetical protein